MAYHAENIAPPRQRRLIRKADLLKKVPFSKSMLALRLNPKSQYYDPTLPSPIYFPGSRIPYWDEAEVDIWITTAASTASKNATDQISTAPSAPTVQHETSRASIRKAATQSARKAPPDARRARVTGPIRLQQSTEVPAARADSTHTASEDSLAPPATVSARLSCDDYVVTLPAAQAAPQHTALPHHDGANEPSKFSQPGATLLHSSIEPTVYAGPANPGIGNRYLQPAPPAVDPAIEPWGRGAYNPTQFAGHSMGALADHWRPGFVQSPPSYMSGDVQYEGQPADQRPASIRPANPADGWCYV